MKIEELDVQAVAALKIMLEENISFNKLTPAELIPAYKTVQWVLELEKRIAADYAKSQQPPEVKEVKPVAKKKTVTKKTASK